jgi:hypothetical protein
VVIANGSVVSSCTRDSYVVAVVLYICRSRKSVKIQQGLISLSLSVFHCLCSFASVVPVLTSPTLFQYLEHSLT